MERHEVPEDGRLAEPGARAERGDEVVIVREGRTVASIELRSVTTPSGTGIDRDALCRLHAIRDPAKEGEGAALVREMRTNVEGIS